MDLPVWTETWSSHRTLRGRNRRTAFAAMFTFPEPPYRARASKVAGRSERTWIPQWSPARVTIHSAGTVQ